jgi:hypothetical protein
VSQTFTLTAEQFDEFERHGVVRAPGFYERADIEAMADRLWADLERRFGVRRDQRQTWTVGMPAKFNALRRSGAFAGLGSPKVRALADALLGAGAWLAPAHWGGLLVTFPTPAPIMARPPWHLDIGGSERLDPLPILRIFTFLEPAAPGGGGTLYVAGSHRLAMDIERETGARVRSSQVRERLRAEHPWFAQLLKTPTDQLRSLVDVPAQVGGHTVSLAEMTGEVGDLVIMHPAVLHGTGHNALDRPRMMLTDWILRKETVRA